MGTNGCALRSERGSCTSHQPHGRGCGAPSPDSSRQSRRHGPEGEAFLRTDITPLGDYEFSEDAHAWEIGGTGNSPGTVGLSVALSLILDLGPQHIERHIHTLADHLEDALDRRGLTVVSPPDPRYRSGIVTFSTGHVTADVSLMRSLVAAGVAVSVRFASGARGVRGSCHHYNTIEDVELPLEGIDTWRQ